MRHTTSQKCTTEVESKCWCWFHCAALTHYSLVVDQVEVNHGDGRPHAQQGEDDEPGEEAAAAGAGVGLLPILIGRLRFGGICRKAQWIVSGLLLQPNTLLR